MSDPQSPENLPARPPLAPAPSAAPAYGEASIPPPNPFGQPAAGRHATPPSAPSGDTGPTPEQSYGFAPPSSPGFGAPGTAAYGAYPQTPAPPMSGYAQNVQEAPPAQQYSQPGYQAPGYPAYPQDQPYPTVTEKRAKPEKPTATLANTGLALGVIGVLGGIFFGWTLLLSLAAVVLGVLARSREPHARGVALSAIVTGIVGVVLSLGWLTYSVITWLALTAS